MTSRTKTIRKGALGILLLGLLVPTLGSAQVAVAPELEEVEITRDAAALRTEIDVADRDLVDTALVFSNLGRNQARVACRASDADGNPVGRIYIRVPAGGLRYALASDLSNDQDFAGSVICRANPRVRGSAVLLAPLAMTDLSVQHLRRGSLIIIPVAATY